MERFLESDLKRIGVFCGAKIGTHESYKDLAVSLGRKFADQGIGLVYGGAKIGLMGAIADSVIRNGGNVIGIIPKQILELEVAHTGLSELIKVEGMHERKKAIYDHSDSFLALPGGFGTLDELFEVLTWNQLSIHKKPVHVLNLSGFFNNLLLHLDHLVKEGFLAESHRRLVEVFPSVSDWERNVIC